MARISKNQLLKLRKKYTTDQAIARLYGISKQAVNQLRIRYGVPAAEHRNRERDQQIANLYRRGVSGTRIASEFKLSVTHTYRIINRALGARIDKRKKRTDPAGGAPVA
jgi:DNA invertase Pin-like site-specific DNA recombinase